MDERVWIGSMGRTPTGWVGLESVETYLTSALSAIRIVIDDPAAALREADFLKLFEHSPLAKIERVVGPWRAGLGRTDPTWPFVTTQSGTLNHPNDWSRDLLPLTAAYEEIAADLVAQPVCLDEISVSVQIADEELRLMWEDLLPTVGAELLAQPESAAVWLMDGSPRSKLSAGVALCVHLTTAPWLVPPSANEVAFSTSESPWSVMHSIAERLKRGDREVD